jgi:membrane-associated phospholipid phosphatase
VSSAQGKTLSENARIFALLGMAICDASIAVFDTKYFYNYWRPVTAIRAGDTDDNHKTDPDPTWLPLIATPPFPSYPSGHGTLSGAARTVLEHFFGKSGHSITLSHSALPAIVLNYSSWKQITDDIADARVYGGIHYRFDQTAGARQGRRVATYILQQYLR